MSWGVKSCSVSRAKLISGRPYQWMLSVHTCGFLRPRLQVSVDSLLLLQQFLHFIKRNIAALKSRVTSACAIPPVRRDSRLCHTRSACSWATRCRLGAYDSTPRILCLTVFRGLKLRALVSGDLIWGVDIVV